MKLAFVLGRKYSLALSEILEVFKRDQISFDVVSVSTEWLIVDIKAENPENFAAVMQKRLGGSIKIVQILEEIDGKDGLGSLSLDKLEKILTQGRKKNDRITYGFSLYGNINVLPEGFSRQFGMILKRYLEDYGHKVRFIFNNQLAIEAVTFEKKIKDKGVDLNFFIAKSGKIYLGKTLTVQNFEGYSKRDYGRPMVSKKSGALPPKLAQMMVNLAVVPGGKRVFDPFCGSGTVLQEAMVQGYQVVGSDLDRKAIQQTEQNLGWLKRAYLHTNQLKFQIFHSAVAKILENADFTKNYVEANKIGGMASEPYLGPTLQNVVRKDKNYNYMLSQVSAVYEDLFSVAGDILKPGQRMILIVPAYKTTEGWELLDIAELYEKDFTKLDLLDTLPESDFGNIDKDLTWDRPQSIIRRFILPLERKKN